MRGPTKASVRHQDGLQIDLRVVEPAPSAPPCSTSPARRPTTSACASSPSGASCKHQRVRRASTRRDRRRGRARRRKSSTRPLGLPWIPPEIREDGGEIEAALARTASRGSSRPSDIKGRPARAHRLDRRTARRSNRSSTAAEAQGLRVHRRLGPLRARRRSRAASRPSAVLEQVRAIENAPAAPPHPHPHGIGVRHPGRRHARLPGRGPRAARRRARLPSTRASSSRAGDDHAHRRARAPASHVLAHPTGRSLGSRDPTRSISSAVFATAGKAHGKAVEINASPNRIDLATSTRGAGALGLPVAVSTDTHCRLRELDNLDLGSASPGSYLGWAPIRSSIPALWLTPGGPGRVRSVDWGPSPPTVRKIWTVRSGSYRTPPVNGQIVDIGR